MDETVCAFIDIYGLFTLKGLTITSPII